MYKFVTYDESGFILGSGTLTESEVDSKVNAIRNLGDFEELRSPGLDTLYRFQRTYSRDSLGNADRYLRWDLHVA